MGVNSSLYSIKIKATLNREQIFDLLNQSVTDFEWISGHSDYQGKYISGIGQNGGDIQIWLELGEEGMIEISVGLEDLDESVADPERWKKALCIVF